MDRATRSFWTVVTALTATSVFFGVRAERARRDVQRAEAEIAPGDIVRFAEVIDGDTVLVQTHAGERVTVRLVGIKAFSREGRDVTTPYGRAAADELARRLADLPIRAQPAGKKDTHGRTLGSLWVEDQDVAMVMLSRGLVMAYTTYPFPAMSLYVKEQREARLARRGLWADGPATAQADALARASREEAAP